MPASVAAYLVGVTTEQSALSTHGATRRATADWSRVIENRTDQESAYRQQPDRLATRIFDSALRPVYSVRATILRLFR
jgi:hypothetical protein